MANNGALIEKLEKLYRLEKEAEEMYAGFLGDIGDEAARGEVEGVMKDEVRHEQIVKSLIAMAKG